MNDLRLHDRLTGLADDLAPDADPWAQASGARALHRRQRRTRIGMTGAAVAIAAVVIGVPTAMSTLSAPRGGDVAVPSSSLPSEGPEGAAEDLSQFVESVQAGLSRLGVDGGSLPDPEAGVPCPDAADALGLATGMYVLEPGGISSGGTLTGCAWSTDATGSTPAERRLDVSLRAAFDATTDSVLRELDSRVAEDGCSWTTVLDGDVFDPLLRCEGPQNTWTLTLIDEDGTGAWVLTSAIGSEAAEVFGTATSTLAELWRIVEDGPATTSADPGAPTDQQVAEHAERIAALMPNLSLAVPADSTCPDAEDLGRYGVTPPATTIPPDRVTCRWSAGAPDSDQPAPLGGSIQYSADGPVTDAVLCPTAPIPGSPTGAELKGCSMGEFVAWTLVVPTADGPGGWVISASGGVVDTPDSAADGPSSLDLLVALVELADQTW